MVTTETWKGRMKIAGGLAHRTLLAGLPSLYDFLCSLRQLLPPTGSSREERSLRHLKVFFAPKPLTKGKSIAN